MDLVYRLLGQGDQFNATFRTSAAETRRLDNQLEKLITTMERQRDAGAISAREQEILTLADKGATNAKVDYAIALSREIDSLEALAVAEANEAAEKKRREAGVNSVISALERENQALVLTEAELLDFQLTSAGATSAEMQFAQEVLAANVVLRDQATSLANLAAAEQRATQYAQDLSSKLSFQVQNFHLSEEAVERLRLRKQGLSESEIQHVMTLQQELAALQATRTAEQEAERSKQASEDAVARLVRQLKEEESTLGLSTEQLLRRELAANGADAATINLAVSLQRKISAENEAATSTANLAAAEQRAAQYAQDLISKLSFQNQTYFMSAEAVERLRLRKIGLSEAEIEHIITLQREAAELARFTQGVGAATRGASTLSDVLYRAEQDAWGRFSKGAGGTSNALQNSTGAMGKNLFMIQALSLGVQDAAQVYGNMGLAGAINASANNLIFAAGMIHPVAGIVAALTATVVQLGMAWWKTGEQAKESAEDEAQAAEITIEALDAVAEARARAANRQLVRDTRDMTGEQVQRQIQNRQDEAERNRAEQNELAARQRQIAGKYFSEEHTQSIGATPIMNRDDNALNQLAAANQGTVDIAKRDLSEFQELNDRLYELQLERMRLAEEERKLKPALVEAQKRDELKARAEAVDEQQREAERESKEWLDQQARSEQRAKKEQQDRERHLDAMRQIDINALKDRDSVEAEKSAVLDRHMEERRKIEEAYKAGAINRDYRDYMLQTSDNAYQQRLKNIDRQAAKRDAAPKDLSATTATSTEGYKAIWNALGIGQPKESMEDLQKKGNEIAAAGVAKQDEMLAKLDELLPVTTGVA